MCIRDSLYVLFGYSMSFGTQDIGGILANPFEKAGLSGTEGLVNPFGYQGYGHIPELAFVGFQMTFAIITVALISGAIADRGKFSTWLVLSGLWVTLSYFTIAHMVWGGGLLSANEHGLAARTFGVVVGRAHRYGYAGGQGFRGKVAALFQEAWQRTAADRQHDVVEGAFRRLGEVAQALHRKLLGGEAALLAHAAVEHRLRRGERHHHALASAQALEHPAEGDHQLRHRPRLAAQGLDRRLHRRDVAADDGGDVAATVAPVSYTHLTLPTSDLV